ncbi:MAG: site-specific DNA-methyltransferase [Pseudoalteromonas sp.]|nr:site-specific DNA-methyltransferase [Pseudoalteromonas sp.]
MLGDCLERIKEIPDGSVDLIVCDLPFGTMKGAQLDGWSNKTTEWDTVIDSSLIMKESDRILRKNGKAVLFAQQPFTTELINAAIPNLPFNYTMTWEKDHFANALVAKKAPVSYAEDILVFSKKHDQQLLHPLRAYFKRIMSFTGLNLKQINEELGHRRAEHAFYIDSTQFGLCTSKTYQELIDVFKIDSMDKFKLYKELEFINSAFNSVFNSVFNLWDGNKFKSNILKYKKDYDGHHPTQKPVLLLEDLIKTFSNEGDLIVDMTMGSGSTGVAAKNLNRKFIGIEMDEGYFEIAKKRINEA